MLTRLRSGIYGAPDLTKLKGFYAALLDKAPYFDQPYYCGFDIDGFELGLDPEAPPTDRANAYWRVESIGATLARVQTLGGRTLGAPHEVGGGIVMATFGDPCGNVVGLIEERGE